MKSRTAFLALLGLLSLAGCNYDFPLTEKPTHKVDPRVIGDWETSNRDNQQREPLRIRQLDRETYVVATDGGLYRVTHSAVPGADLVSVQDLQPGEDRGKFAYYEWKLSADGQELSIRLVRTGVVPEETPDAATAQRLIREHLTDPALFGDPTVFRPARP